jgi:hypothetical protein
VGRPLLADLRHHHLSSLATERDHIDHVRSQLPCALAVGLVGLFAGTLPMACFIPGGAGY